MSMYRILVVGNPNPEHIGSHLLQAGRSLGLEIVLCDSRIASNGPRLLVSAAWRAGRFPLRIERFEQHLLETCSRESIGLVICTGIAPVRLRAIEQLHKNGVTVWNYLTDDPWNRNHYAAWFLKSLPAYDHVFSPRMANLADLRAAGVKCVSYLRFAYNPEIHFPDSTEIPGREDSEADVVFVGGADPDRVPFMEALARAGLKLKLYGGYWGRYSETRNYACGMADPPMVRRVTGRGRVAMCLVRRSNRDGHCMRTFEIPAMGGCLLAESTPDHRELFGEESKAALYFENIPEMVEKTRWLLDHPVERRRLAAAAHQLITGGRHTYRDRLIEMLQYEIDRSPVNLAVGGKL